METSESQQKMTNPSTVTKTKSSGRVAAGKRLAEFNKLNKVQKQKMKKGTDQETKTMTAPPQKETSSNTNKSYINYVVFGGGLAALVVGAYFYKQKKCPQKKEPVKAEKEESIPSQKIPCKNIDPFYME